MKTSKQSIFDVKYTSVLKKIEKKKRTSNIIRFICKHKIISTAIAIFMICVIMNLLLIYNFFKILQQI